MCSYACRAQLRRELVVPVMPDRDAIPYLASIVPEQRLQAEHALNVLDLDTEPQPTKLRMVRDTLDLIANPPAIASPIRKEPGGKGGAA